MIGRAQAMRSLHARLLPLLAAAGLAQSGVAASVRADDLDVEAAVKAGVEADTNPRRLNGDGSAADVADRLFVEVNLAESSADQALSGGVQIGGKRYHQTGSESTLVVDGSGAYQRRLVGGLGAYVRILARDRLEAGHERDYARLTGRAGLSLRLEPITLSAGPLAEYFLYRPDADLSYLMAGVSAQVGWSPSDAVGVVASYSYGHRDYHEARILSDALGLRIGEPLRGDEGHLAGLGASLDMGFVANLDLFVQRNDSNSYGSSFTRLSARGSATFSLPWRLFLTVQATVQRTLFDDQVLIDPTFSIDEEDRNSGVVALSGDLTDWLGWEVRYSLYTQAFGGDQADYLRHLVYGGLVATTRD
jgi:hypothetical protein